MARKKEVPPPASSEVGQSIRLRIDKELLDHWKQAAQARGQTLSDLIRDSVRRHVDERDPDAVADFGHRVLELARSVDRPK